MQPAGNLLNDLVVNEFNQAGNTGRWLAGIDPDLRVLYRDHAVVDLLVPRCLRDGADEVLSRVLAPTYAQQHSGEGERRAVSTSLLRPVPS